MHFVKLLRALKNTKITVDFHVLFLGRVLMFFASDLHSRKRAIFLKKQRL